MSRNDYFDVRSAYLAHYGVKGMKWRFHKYLNQAGRRLRAYGTIAGVGLRRAGKKIGAALNKARLALKTKYNPGAIGRRISRAYNIYNMNKQTQAKKGTTGIRSVLYKRGSTPKQSDYSKHNPSQRYSPSHYTPKSYASGNRDSQGRSYVGSANGKSYYGKKSNPTNRTHSGNKSGASAGEILRNPWTAAYKASQRKKKNRW